MSLEMNNKLSMAVNVVCKPESNVERLFISTELAYFFRVDDYIKNRKSCFHQVRETLQEHLGQWNISNWEFELLLHIK